MAMNPNVRLIEMSQIAAGFNPVDMQTGANTGDWVTMNNWRRLLIVLFKGIGTAGDDPTITVQQATDVSGTGAKALTFTEVWKKQGTLTAIEQFTKVTQAAANTYTNDTLAESAAIVCIEIRTDDLDIDGSFDCVRATVADVGGNAQLGAMLYIPYDPRYAADPPPTAIA